MGKNNMVKKGEQTEEKIVEAARAIFHEKGFHGARMQEIADSAEINKGLLHYYFKTKDALFEKVFGIAFHKMFGIMANAMNSDLPLPEKLEKFVGIYMDVLAYNSFLPVFVLSELNRNPDKFIRKIFSVSGRPNMEPFFNQVKAEIAAGRIKDVDPRKILMNTMSLCVFPYVARPMFQAIMNISNPEFKKMMQNRKEEVIELITVMLKP
ncbi:MAG: TetR/AcrR family transcriptional regulator [Bacteroidia bacterium]|nr:TetR/AcrR family transcriptional regulator [Bacteroidia bacterium]